MLSDDVSAELGLTVAFSPQSIWSAQVFQLFLSLFLLFLL